MLDLGFTNHVSTARANSVKALKLGKLSPVVVQNVRVITILFPAHWKQLRF